MTNSLNSVSVIGNLVRDSVLKTFDNGNSVLNFTIAVNRSCKKGDSWEDEAYSFDIVYFSKSASKISQYLVKGQSVAVQGYLKQERWEKDGKKNSAVKIMADNLQLLGSRNQGNQGKTSQGEPTAHYQDDEFLEELPF